VDEREYWSRLEYRLCAEFRGMTEGHLSEYWCDGISGETYFITGRRPRILGHAWICLASKTMEEWQFELLLPHRVRSREHIDWAALMPADDVTRWLAVDLERRFIQIEPAAAVPDLK
jgi:hypothetical protein